jgi:hypothetical protein
MGISDSMGPNGTSHRPQNSAGQAHVVADASAISLGHKTAPFSHYPYFDRLMRFLSRPARDELEISKPVQNCRFSSDQ